MMVSIGMPVYNGEQYIEEAIKSILNQTYKDFELIISDNASTDKTQEFCKKYSKSDCRIRYFIQKQNMGAMNNFQFVFEKANGNYFMWVAADDILSKKYLESLMKIVQTFNCLVYGRVVTINSNSELVLNPSSGRAFNFSGVVIFRRIKYYISVSAFGKANPIYGLMPSSYLKNNLNNILSLQNKSGGDLLFMYNLLKHLDVKSCKDSKFYKRIHLNSGGGGEDIFNSKPIRIKNIFKDSSMFFKNILKERLLQFVLFYRFSSRLEKFLIVFLFPFLLIRDSYLLLNWHLRFKLKYLS